MVSPKIKNHRDAHRAMIRGNEDSGTSDLIYVCSLNAVDTTLTTSRATHLISLINSDLMIDTPHVIEKENHLQLSMNDIVEPTDNRIIPDRQHIQKLLAFTRNWNRRAPLLIHCLAGISRSTAATYITLCALNPETSERHIAQELRSASPTAQPNHLMISIADVIMERDGRMISAIDELGLADIATEGQPFHITASHEA